MPLVSMTEMLKKANAEGYAVGQFNLNNLEFTQAILMAAQEEKSPVILGVSEGAARYMGGFKTVVKMVEGLMEDYKVTVPVAIHLDHGSSFEKCKEAIDAGFTSVMIDASHGPFEENVSTTTKVVEYAHSKGVSVEAELGVVGGQEDDVVADGVIYADPKECEELVKRTGIDCLAPA
ncbi:MAG: ketose-bisphosphate aldolase, partial [Bacillota bacterium]|nr:ketose-bisphosphate aldolase [Bacillota bacterium]